MVKHIIHTSDWHLKPLESLEKKDFNHQKFQASIDRMLEILDEKLKGVNPQEVRFVIVGDLFDNKEKEATNESIEIMGKCLKKISDRYPLIITIGNHDYDINNKSRLDCITPIYNLLKINNESRIKYYKHSGCIVDDNIVFCNYSNYDNNSRPNIEKFRKLYPNKKFIGLYHDIVYGSTNFNNLKMQDISSHYDSVNIFNGCDTVLMGDIHKHQTVFYDKGKKAVYSGSLFQLNKGETVKGHGFCLWNVQDLSYEFLEVEIPYAMYKLRLKSFDDISNKSYKFLNINY